MKLFHSQKIKCDVSEEIEEQIISCLERTLKLTSEGTLIPDKHGFSCSDVNCSFGSILRNDNVAVSIKQVANKTGYIVEAEITYKPSFCFWILFILEILLCGAIIGFLGLIATVGLYFYNKNLVENTVISALQTTKEEIE